MIRVEEVSKVFGPDPQSILPRLRSGESKDDISRETGHVVGINQASFEVQPGEVFCIMGLSGSGKSTLIRCVNRLIEPTAGRIVFDDPDGEEQDVTALDADALRRLRMTQMSMVFQHFALFPHRTVLANATYGLEVQGRDKAERERIGQEVLERVGLGQWGRAYPAELSGGMQQRVGLARALATRGRVMLMDEAFSALDPLIKVQMQQMLMEIQEEVQRTILFITHDLDEAMRIGDRIAIMDAGEIVQIGTPEEILVNPRTEYVADFVEHADATSVITAQTIAVPFASGRFRKSGEEKGLTLYASPTQPDVEYVLDSDQRLQEVRVDGSPVRLRALAEQTGSGEAASTTRERGLALHCNGDTVLRQILQGRVHSSLPTLVTDEDQRLLGVIDEPELVRGILEKRGQTEAESQPAAATA